MTGPDGVENEAQTNSKVVCWGIDSIFLTTKWSLKYIMTPPPRGCFAEVRGRQTSICRYPGGAERRTGTSSVSWCQLSDILRTSSWWSVIKSETAVNLPPRKRTLRVAIFKPFCFVNAFIYFHFHRRVCYISLSRRRCNRSRHSELSTCCSAHTGDWQV